VRVHTYARIREILRASCIRVINRVMDAAKAKVTTAEPYKVQRPFSCVFLLSPFPAISELPPSLSLSLSLMLLTFNPDTRERIPAERARSTASLFNPARYRRGGSNAARTKKRGDSLITRHPREDRRTQNRASLPKAGLFPSILAASLRNITYFAIGQSCVPRANARETSSPAAR